MKKYYLFFMIWYLILIIFVGKHGYIKIWIKLYGHNYITVFWFQYDLIIVTVVIVISELLFRKYKLFFLINLEIISFYAQYSNHNYKLFSKLCFYQKFTFGRFAEIIPYCVTGYIFAYLKISIVLQKNNYYYLYCFSILLFLSVKYNIFNSINGFYYQGFKLYTISLCLFNIFLLFPSEIITNNKFIKFIKFITNYTSGVYFLHLSVFKYIKKYSSLIKNETLYGCIIIYLICYLISFLGVLIFGKTKLKHLFQ